VRDWLQQVVERIETLEWVEPRPGIHIANLSGESSYTIIGERADLVGVGYSVAYRDFSEQQLAENVESVDEAKAIAERHHAEHVAFIMDDINPAAAPSIGERADVR
jgi:hypothetical protein